MRDYLLLGSGNLPMVTYIVDANATISQPREDWSVWRPANIVVTNGASFTFSHCETMPNLVQLTLEDADKVTLKNVHAENFLARYTGQATGLVTVNGDDNGSLENITVLIG